MAHDDVLIRVHEGWDAWRHAEVRLADIEDVHWFQPHGAPQPMIHAYIRCSAIVGGDIPHECDRQSAGHRLRVCILRRHSIASAYAALTQRAGRRDPLPLPLMDGIVAALQPLNPRRLRPTRPRRL